MGYDFDVVGREGLQFFGTMSASISHEIKNVLAVLNENAGLLEDLALMAQKGGSLDHERVKSVAGSMKKQIRRADVIAKNMNRFAHSVDQFENSVDMRETLELVVALCTRFADMRGVKLDPLYPEGELHLSTNPFFLENLLWCCMDHAMSATGEGKTVSISMDKMETGVRIKLAGLQGLKGSDVDVFPSERESALLGALDAEIETDAGAGHIIVKLPEKTDS